MDRLPAFEVAKLLVLRAHTESLESNNGTKMKCTDLLAEARKYIEKAIQSGVVVELPALSFLGEKIRHGRLQRAKNTDMTQLDKYLSEKKYLQVTQKELDAMNTHNADICFNKYVQGFTREEFGDKENNVIKQEGNYTNWIAMVAGLDYNNWGS